MKFFKIVSLFLLLGLSNCLLISMDSKNKPQGLPRSPRSDNLPGLERSDISVLNSSPATNDDPLTLQQQIALIEHDIAEITLQYGINTLKNTNVTKLLENEMSKKFKNNAASAERTLQADRKKTVNKLLQAYSVGSTAATILLIMRTYSQNSDESGPIIHRGILETGAEAATSIATGGMSSIATEVGSKAMTLAIAGACGYGLKQLADLVRSPLKHAAKKDEIHAEEMESRSAAHRKAMDRQSRVHQEAIEAMKATYSKNFEELQMKIDNFMKTSNRQQELQIDTTNELGTRVATLAKTVNLHEQRLQRGLLIASKLQKENAEDAKAINDHARQVDQLKKMVNLLQRKILEKSKAERCPEAPTSPASEHSFAESSNAVTIQQREFNSSMPTSSQQELQEDAIRVPVVETEKVSPSGCCICC